MNRRGSTLLEIMVATVLVGALLALSVQVFGWTARERRTVDRRATALVEAGNQLDELTRLSWNEVTEKRMKQAELSKEAAAILSDAKLDVTLSESTSVPVAKQIIVAIDWQGDHGLRDAPVRLSAWVFK